MIKLMKEVLGDRVEQVTISSRMAVLPVLTTAEYGWSANKDCIMIRPPEVIGKPTLKAGRGVGVFDAARVL